MSNFLLGDGHGTKRAVAALLCKWHVIVVLWWALVLLRR